MAIEKAIAENPVKREAWINRQLEIKPVKLPEGEVSGLNAES